MIKLQFTVQLCASIAIAAAVPSVHADDGFAIEDSTLRPTPLAALKALRAHVKNTNYKECAAGSFVGAAVDLLGSGEKRDWIAKTADGCGWGAASAKIWVLKRNGTTYRVVLDTGGQGVTLLGLKSHGLRDLKMAGGTAGYYSEELLKFDGSLYKVFKSCAIDLQDPKEQQRHPDGQCHVN